MRYVSPTLSPPTFAPPADRSTAALAASARLPHAAADLHRSPSATGLAVSATTALVPWHPSWPARFRVESIVLRTALEGLQARFEHVGTTAVEGLPARPIVDILLGLPRVTQLGSYVDRLRNFGYALAPDAVLESGACFLVRTVRGVQTHEVRVVETFSDAWHRVLLFRDLRRADALLAAEYEGVRRRLARDHAGDASGYERAKGLFIDTVLHA